MMLHNLRVAFAAIMIVSSLFGAAAPAVAGEDGPLFCRPLLGGYKGTLP
jgi:hypothetical protein